MNRREILCGTATLLAGVLPGVPAAASDDPALRKVGHGAAEGWAAIERGVHGRLGVAVLDTGSGTLSGHRLDERFPMCSTFKCLAAALVLARVDAGQERLNRRVVVTRESLLEWSPVTSQHVDGAGMTMAELCEAAVTVSDNPAANLLLQGVGGPAGLTAFLRRIGDDVTRLDRNEPTLNQAVPGDPRDTSTPRAMARTLRTLLLGDALSARSREQLLRWMAATTTGAKRLRAGLPADWKIADKTGTGRLGTTNDVALLQPPHGAPLVVVAYLTQSKADADARERALAAVGRLVAGRGWRPAA